jgi:hypothetical protein
MGETLLFVSTSNKRLQQQHNRAAVTHQPHQAAEVSSVRRAACREAAAVVVTSTSNKRWVGPNDPLTPSHWSRWRRRLQRAATTPTWTDCLCQLSGTAAPQGWYCYTNCCPRLQQRPISLLGICPLFYIVPRGRFLNAPNKPLFDHPHCWHPPQEPPISLHAPCPLFLHVSCPLLPRHCSLHVPCPLLPRQPRPALASWQNAPPITHQTWMLPPSAVTPHLCLALHPSRYAAHKHLPSPPHS